MRSLDDAGPAIVVGCSGCCGRGEQVGVLEVDGQGEAQGRDVIVVEEGIGEDGEEGEQQGKEEEEGGG